MRAFLAGISADRISHSTLVVAGALCGILVFFVAVPLALSSPFPAPREGTWVIDRPSPHIAAPVTLRPDLDQQDTVLESEMIIPWSFVSLPASGVASRFEPAELGDPEPAGGIVTGTIGELASQPSSAAAAPP